MNSIPSLQGDVLTSERDQLPEVEGIPRETGSLQFQGLLRRSNGRSDNNNHVTSFKKSLVQGPVENKKNLQLTITRKIVRKK